jgi:hypothetical protein
VLRDDASGKPERSCEMRARSMRLFMCVLLYNGQVLLHLWILLDKKAKLPYDLWLTTLLPMIPPDVGESTHS